MTLDQLRRWCGFLAIVAGLGLLWNSSTLLPRTMSAEDMELTSAGSCYVCDTTAGCSGSVDCEESTKQEGRYVKITTTGQGEASCGTTEEEGPKTCEVDTYLLCTTTTYCDDDACTVNCTSTTTKVPTNCNTSGSCQDY